MFFQGFTLTTMDVPAGPIRLRHNLAASGETRPPLLLLHGNPQTSAMWHRVAPALGERFALVCPDLRGYGGSLKPPVSDDHAAYSKREMARDMVALMEQLGFRRFAIGSHDRGARVAHRLALDFPERVERLAVLDIVPTIEHFERADMAFAMGYYHWFWFAQKHPFPEVLINAAPEAWFRAHIGRGASASQLFAPEALAEYLAAARDPLVIQGMCEDYRAAASIDLEHDRQSRAEGRKIQCPLLVLWGARGYVGVWYDPLAIWRAYCDAEVTGGPVDSGHYIPEEAPEETIAWFRKFFGD
jgi:haloacetate dehalogenase